jgi:hypothetical protein
MVRVRTLDSPPGYPSSKPLGRCFQRSHAAFSWTNAPSETRLHKRDSAQYAGQGRQDSNLQPAVLETEGRTSGLQGERGSGGSCATVCATVKGSWFGSGPGGRGGLKAPRRRSSGGEMG